MDWSWVEIVLLRSRRGIFSRDWDGVNRLQGVSSWRRGFRVFLGKSYIFPH